MRISLTTVRNFCLPLFYLLLLLILTAHPQAKECTTGKGLASNYLYSLTGKSDTLWTLALKDASLAFNMIAGANAFNDVADENNWWSYAPDCMGEYQNLMYDGGIYALASFDTTDNILWLYNHETGRSKQVSFRWPGISDTLYRLDCIGAVWANEQFHLACHDGGLVLWDPEVSSQTVIFPGKA